MTTAPPFSFITSFATISPAACEYISPTSPWPAPVKTSSTTADKKPRARNHAGASFGFPVYISGKNSITACTILRSLNFERVSATCEPPALMCTMAPPPPVPTSSRSAVNSPFRVRCCAHSRRTHWPWTREPASPRRYVRMPQLLSETVPVGAAPGVAVWTACMWEGWGRACR